MLAADAPFVMGKIPACRLCVERRPGMMGKAEIYLVLYDIFCIFKADGL
jgi:hypothetical protein